MEPKPLPAPINDKNLNSEIETTENSVFSLHFVILSTIRISILRLKLELNLRSLKRGNLSTIRISILRLKQ